MQRFIRTATTSASTTAKPQGRECLPQPEFLAWHRAEVFKEPAREQPGRIGANTGLVSEIG